MKRVTSMLLILFIISSCADEATEDTSTVKLIEYEEYSSDLNEVVSSVFFIDDQTGFASGPGIIYKTTNGGINWESDTITPLRLHSIYFASKDVGFAVGGEAGCTGTGCTPPGSIIYKTTD